MDIPKLSKQALYINQFALEGTMTEIREYGSGHINATYRVTMEADGKQKRYIFQQINTDVFRDVAGLMENVCNVTAYLRRKILERHGDPDRETLQVIPTRSGENFFRDEEGRCYRVYRFIEDADNYDAVKNPRDFYESAAAFGNFQFLLSDYPADSLHETIPDFHHTGKRYRAFEAAVREDAAGKAATSGEEIGFVMEHAGETTCLTDLLASGKLPLRVTHNDTKLNNVMFDRKTGKGLCVIDLDTVMPGSALYDFGDAIRYGANAAAEDETDLSKVSLDLSLYEEYVKGYLEGCHGSLTEQEIKLLPMGAKIMTLECGMRFLEDHLRGDVYFRIHRENHNLDRCRTQFALVRDMEKKWDDMKRITEKYKRVFPASFCHA